MKNKTKKMTKEELDRWVIQAGILILINNDISKFFLKHNYLSRQEFIDMYRKSEKTALNRFIKFNKDTKN